MAGQTVFMFSGQGSHYYHMAGELFAGHAAFRRRMLALDEVARGACGHSIVAALYSDARRKADPFERTLFSHPAIFMVEHALAETLQEAGVHADMVLGASMGAFAAAAFAGFLDVEQALLAVVRQARALEEQAEPGGMTAVLAAPSLFDEGFLNERAELAAVNFSEHFVVSARSAEQVEIEAALARRDVGFQRLAVSFPFHSRWMDEARAPFEAFMRQVPCRTGSLPLVCSAHGAGLTELPPGYFWSAVRRPIRFRETIAQLERGGPRRYVDVGPAGTLATFVKYALPPDSASSTHAILTPYGRDQKSLAAAAARLAH